MSTWAGVRPLVKEFKTEEKPQETGLVAMGKSAVRWLARTIHHDGKKKKSSDTARLSRSHVIEVSSSGLVSLMGGKWTSFRVMGEETVDLAVSQKENKLQPKYESSVTQDFNLIGSYSRMEAIHGIIPTNQALIDQYEDHITLTRDLPRDIAKHLVHTYGTRSLRIVELGEKNASKKHLGTNDRVHPDYPFTKSEISYAAS